MVGDGAEKTDTVREEAKKNSIGLKGREEKGSSKKGKTENPPPPSKGFVLFTITDFVCPRIFFN